MGNVWTDVIWNSGFASNVAAELLGAVVIVGAVSYVLRAWAKRQRALPTILALQRLNASAIHSLNLASGHLGLGFSAEIRDWTPSRAMESLAVFVGDDDPAKEKRAGEDRTNWSTLGAELVKEHDRLDRTLGNYWFVFNDDPALLRSFTLMDHQIDKVRSCLEVLNGQANHFPSMVEVVQTRLIDYVAVCIATAAGLYAAAANRLRGAGDYDAPAIRSMAAFSRHMEPLFREYEEQQKRKSRKPKKLSKAKAPPSP